MSAETSIDATEEDCGVAKLVFAGPVGAGKTTAIRTVTDREPISTEMPLSEGPIGSKTTTTVALDFSTATLDDGTPLLVYGLPGQERFAFMRSIVLEGAFGVVVVLDGSSADIGRECEHWMREIRAIRSDLAIVVGITHTDETPSFTLAPIREAIRRSGAPVPTFTFDARDRAQTIHLVRALLTTMQ
jgi:signal recognition particle receptor subunit beta